MAGADLFTARAFAWAAPAVVVAVVASAVALRGRGPTSRAARILLVVLVAGLAIGTASHLENLTRAGLVPRPELPLAYNLFWSSLVIVDPIVAAVLLIAPRTGVLLVLGVMGADLTVNLTTLGITPPVLVLMVFALFALIAAPVVRAATPRRGAR